MLKLGVHVSIAGKVYKSVERAAALYCNTMQIFSRNPRQWRKATVSDEDAAVFKERVKELDQKLLFGMLQRMYGMAKANGRSSRDKSE